MGHAMGIRFRKCVYLLQLHLNMEIDTKAMRPTSHLFCACWRLHQLLPSRIFCNTHSAPQHRLEFQFHAQHTARTSDANQLLPYGAQAVAHAHSLHGQPPSTL